MSSHSHGMLADRGGMPELVAARGPHDIFFSPPLFYRNGGH